MTYSAALLNKTMIDLVFEPVTDPTFGSYRSFCLSFIVLLISDTVAMNIIAATVSLSSLESIVMSAYNHATNTQLTKPAQCETDLQLTTSLTPHVSTSWLYDIICVGGYHVAKPPLEPRSTTS